MAKPKYCIKMIYLKRIVTHYNKAYKDKLTLWQSMTTHPADKVYYLGTNVSLSIEREVLQQFGKNKQSNRVFVTVCNLDGRILSLDVWELVSPTEIVFYSKNRSKSDVTDYEVYDDMSKAYDAIQIAYTELLKRYNDLLQKQSAQINTQITMNDASTQNTQINTQKKQWSNHKGGRRKMFTSDDVANIKSLVASGESITNIAKEYRVTRHTIYKYLKN